MCTRLQVRRSLAALTGAIDTSHDHGKYAIEFKGRQVMDTRALICQYGMKKRLYRIADVSNGDFDEVGGVCSG